MGGVGSTPAEMEGQAATEPKPVAEMAEEEARAEAARVALQIGALEQTLGDLRARRDALLARAEEVRRQQQRAAPQVRVVDGKFVLSPEASGGPPGSGGTVQVDVGPFEEYLRGLDAPSLQGLADQLRFDTAGLAGQGPIAGALAAKFARDVTAAYEKDGQLDERLQKLIDHFGIKVEKVPPAPAAASGAPSSTVTKVPTPVPAFKGLGPFPAAAPGGEPLAAFAAAFTARLKGIGKADLESVAKLGAVDTKGLSAHDIVEAVVGKVVQGATEAIAQTGQLPKIVPELVERFQLDVDLDAAQARVWAAAQAKVSAEASLAGASSPGTSPLPGAKDGLPFALGSGAPTGKGKRRVASPRPSVPASPAKDAARLPSGPSAPPPSSAGL